MCKNIPECYRRPAGYVVLNGRSKRKRDSNRYAATMKKSKINLEMLRRAR